MDSEQEKSPLEIIQNLQAQLKLEHREANDRIQSEILALEKKLNRKTDIKAVGDVVTSGKSKKLHAHTFDSDISGGQLEIDSSQSKAGEKLVRKAQTGSIPAKSTSRLLPLVITPSPIEFNKYEVAKASSVLVTILNTRPRMSRFRLSSTDVRLQMNPLVSKSISPGLSFTFRLSYTATSLEDLDSFITVTDEFASETITILAIYRTPEFASGPVDIGTFCIGMDYTYLLSLTNIGDPGIVTYAIESDTISPASQDCSIRIVDKLEIPLMIANTFNETAESNSLLRLTFENGKHFCIPLIATFVKPKISFFGNVNGDDKMCIDFGEVTCTCSSEIEVQLFNPLDIEIPYSTKVSVPFSVTPTSGRFNPNSCMKILIKFDGSRSLSPERVEGATLELSYHGHSLLFGNLLARTIDLEYDIEPSYLPVPNSITAGELVTIPVKLKHNASHPISFDALVECASAMVAVTPVVGVLSPGKYPELVLSIRGLSGSIDGRLSILALGKKQMYEFHTSVPEPRAFLSVSKSIIDWGLGTSGRKLEENFVINNPSTLPVDWNLEHDFPHDIVQISPIDGILKPGEFVTIKVSCSTDKEIVVDGYAKIMSKKRLLTGIKILAAIELPFLEVSIDGQVQCYLGQISHRSLILKNQKRIPASFSLNNFSRDGMTIIFEKLQGTLQPSSELSIAVQITAEIDSTQTITIPLSVTYQSAYTSPSFDLTCIPIPIECTINLDQCYCVMTETDALFETFTLQKPTSESLELIDIPLHSRTVVSFTLDNQCTLPITVSLSTDKYITVERYRKPYDSRSDSKPGFHMQLGREFVKNRFDRAQFTERNNRMLGNNLGLSINIPQNIVIAPGGRLKCQMDIYADMPGNYTDTLKIKYGNSTKSIAIDVHVVGCPIECPLKDGIVRFNDNERRVQFINKSPFMLKVDWACLVKLNQPRFRYDIDYRSFTTDSKLVGNVEFSQYGYDSCNAFTSTEEATVFQPYSSQLLTIKTSRSVDAALLRGEISKYSRSDNRWLPSQIRSDGRIDIDPVIVELQIVRDDKS